MKTQIIANNKSSAICMELH